MSADVYQPAAIKQLETLAMMLALTSSSHLRLTRSRLILLTLQSTTRRRNSTTCYWVDTAGRLAIWWREMMGEIQELHNTAINRSWDFIRCWMLWDRSRCGNTAKAFGDAPTQPVLSNESWWWCAWWCAPARLAITGKPIKFLGVGEKTDAARTIPPRSCYRI